MGAVTITASARSVVPSASSASTDVGEWVMRWTGVMRVRERSPMSRGWAARVPGGCSVCGVSFLVFGERAELTARVSGGRSVCSVSVSGFGERDAEFARDPGERSVCSMSVSEFSERDAGAAHSTCKRAVCRGGWLPSSVGEIERWSLTRNMLSRNKFAAKPCQLRLRVSLWGT